MNDTFTINTSKIDPNSINNLTEIESGYKLFNTNLVDLYNGLHPSGLSKLSNIIFSCILHNKIYKKPDSKGYNEEEAKRIFTSIPIQPCDLAKRIHPAKYANGEKDIETDISNILKALTELEDMNIFYIWKFKQPYTFMFIMERDVTSWKYYNKNGFVFPKSLKKILRLSKSMIDTMTSFEKKRERPVNALCIEESFCEFINKIIDKMEPSVLSKLTKWKVGVNIFSFISTLMGELKKLSDYEGYLYDELFINRLPEHIRKKVIKVNKEAIMYPEATQSLELDLIPKNVNLTKKKRKITVKEPKEPKEKKLEETEINKIQPEAEEYCFKSCDPFKNPTEFTRYYRAFLKLYNNDTKFYAFGQEVMLAGDILDTLTLNGRASNLKFLKSWIRFYVVENLKGNNVLKEEKTSLASFKKTFDNYNSNYIG